MCFEAAKGISGWRNRFEGCMDMDGIMHAFNSQWVSNCELCTCGEQFGIHCCSKLKRPRLYDRDRCKEILNKTLCIITVVLKSNPSTFCRVRGYLG
ncbi:beta-microseminoprotein-like [Trichosurus vulpecula]|uniref:beta-microseminoprotein-like n=1 Tax=Trichosurus vulpecula TaxID=9337 RepID=UPI00186B4AFF|nr:beta-microseminoprotein-like [Trichosurus vulpecula]